LAYSVRSYDQSKFQKFRKIDFFKCQKNHQRITCSISKTLNVNCSGLNRSILACNTNFPLKIKCSFIWNRFWPENRKFRKKFRFSGQFFEIFGIGCIPIRGSKYIFLDFIGSNLSKNTTFITVAFFGYLSLLWSCCPLYLDVSKLYLACLAAFFLFLASLKKW